MGYIINDKYLLKDKITKLPLLVDFVEIKVPEYIHGEEYGGKAYHDFYNSTENYHIDKNGIVSIYSTFDETNLTSLIIKGGIFIGIDNGEWGGKLDFRYYGIYDLESKYTIINENVLYIFSFNDEIFVLTGLAHLGSDEGHIHKLEYKNDKWNISESINLESEPRVYKILDNRQILIITNTGFINFDGNKIIENIKNDSWNYLNVNSIYLADDYIYVGARKCLFTINKQNYEIKALIYSQCKTNA